MRLRLFASAILLAGSLFAADPGLLSLAVPDTQVMAGVNVAQLMLSPFGQFLLTQSGPASDAGLQMLIETADFDARRDLREILVSAGGQPGSISAIILARGTFDVPKIIEASLASGATVQTYKGVPILERPRQGSIALPDSTLAISGDTTHVRAAIDRMSAPASINSALAALVNQLSATEDAWYVSMAPLSLLPPQAPGAGPSPFAMLSNVQQVSGGVKFGANAVVSMQAVSATNQDAATLAAGLKALSGIAQMGGSNGDLAQAAALLQSLSVTVDGQITKVSLSILESQIEQMIQASHTNPQAPVAVDPRSLTRSQPSTGEAPQRIRIEGSVQKTKLLQHPEPVYPPLALQARISGVVHLNAIIGKDGTVENLTVASGHPLLVPSALEAVKQWIYAPTLLNGQAVEVATRIEVNFSLVQ
jgi:TonB family protein